MIHEKVYDEVVSKLVNAYPTIAIGDPLDPKTLCGPLHRKESVREYLEGIEEIKKQGGKVLYGGKTLDDNKLGGHFVLPTIVEIDQSKNDQVKLTDSKGNTYFADYVVSTIPVSVHKSGMVKFIPELSWEKQDVTERIYTGTFGKVFAEFEECFWDKNLTVATVLDPKLKLHQAKSWYHVSQKNIIVFSYLNDAIRPFGEFSEEELRQEITTYMKIIYPKANIKITKIKASNWGGDPYSNGTIPCFLSTCYLYFFDDFLPLSLFVQHLPMNSIFF